MGSPRTCNGASSTLTCGERGRRGEHLHARVTAHPRRSPAIAAHRLLRPQGPPAVSGEQRQIRWPSIAINRHQSPSIAINHNQSQSGQVQPCLCLEGQQEHQMRHTAERHQECNQRGQSECNQRHSGRASPGRPIWAACQRSSRQSPQANSPLLRRATAAREGNWRRLPGGPGASAPDE